MESPDANEAKLFNCGPKGYRGLPSSMLGSLEPENLQLQPLVDDSSDGQLMMMQPSTTFNETSNLSASSMSDREQEISPSKLPLTARSPSISRKAIRKRRRVEEPRSDRKITDFAVRTQVQSPKRDKLASNGDSSNNSDSLQMQPSNTPSTSWPSACPSSPSRMTPTKPGNPPSGGYSSSENSRSPPHRARQDAVAQTDGSPWRDPNEEVAQRDRLIEDLQRKNDDTLRQLTQEKRKNEMCKETIKRLLIEQNKLERKALLDKTTADTPRIGMYKMVRQGDQFKDQWVNGYCFEELERRQKEIANERNEITNAMQQLKKRKLTSTQTQKRLNNPSGGGDGATPSTSTLGTDADGFARPEPPQRDLTKEESAEQEEIYRLHKEHLKKQEADLQLEHEQLDRERQLHLRELKRASHERDSRYKDHEVLNRRYLMLSLLGKGGFSEVWRAFDLEENKYVACKIHHVNKEWKEEKKANYVKHAMREKDIHKTLDHARIVKLFDLFTIDNHSFCTVLEFCPGNDLDFYLKQNKTIPEKEARSIIMQVVSALEYLARRKPPIIHYDLKPANILLESGNTCGAIKITDFGLSKQIESSDDTDGQIDLTSQFAGTYWYLPPETFVVSHMPPKISNKVDVWSVGVIFYQCIYGRRPFGHEQTQQKILEENTIIKATEVHFPSKPQVSPAAQDFIRRCLQYRKEDRADVHELKNHQLFTPRYAKNLAMSPMSSRTINKSESFDE